METRNIKTLLLMGIGFPAFLLGTYSMYIGLRNGAFHLLSKIVRFHLCILSSTECNCFMWWMIIRTMIKWYSTISRIYSSPDLHYFVILIWHDFEYIFEWCKLRRNFSKFLFLTINSFQSLHRLLQKIS